MAVAQNIFGDKGICIYYYCHFESSHFSSLKPRPCHERPIAVTIMNDGPDESIPLLERPLHESLDSRRIYRAPLDPYRKETSKQQQQQDDKLSLRNPLYSKPLIFPSEIPRVIEVDPLSSINERLDAVEVGFAAIRHKHDRIQHGKTRRHHHPHHRRHHHRRHHRSSKKRGKKRQKELNSRGYQHLPLDTITEDEIAPLIDPNPQETNLTKDFWPSDLPLEELLGLTPIREDVLYEQDMQGKHAILPEELLGLTAAPKEARIHPDMQGTHAIVPPRQQQVLGETDLPKTPPAHMLRLSDMAFSKSFEDPEEIEVKKKRAHRRLGELLALEEINKSQHSLATESDDRASRRAYWASQGLLLKPSSEDSNNEPDIAGTHPTKVPIPNQEQGGVLPYPDSVAHRTSSQIQEVETRIPKRTNTLIPKEVQGGGLPFPDSAGHRTSSQIQVEPRIPRRTNALIPKRGAARPTTTRVQPLAEEARITATPIPILEPEGEWQRQIARATTTRSSNQRRREYQIYRQYEQVDPIGQEFLPLQGGGPNEPTNVAELSESINKFLREYGKRTQEQRDKKK